jgi:cell division topological specificity factor
MALMDFINRLLGRQAPSASTARQRLQLVLAHDRSDLNPELLEQMRREILEVVSRYVEIDTEAGDVSLETEDRITALVANLPILRARPVAPAADPESAPAAAGDPEPNPQSDGESPAATDPPAPTAAESPLPPEPEWVEVPSD